MSSDSISPSNLPPLSASARFSACSSKARGSSPDFKSAGRSVISPTPTITGMRSSETGEAGMLLFSLVRLVVIPGRCEASSPESRDSGSGANAPSRNDRELFRYQRVQMLDRLDKVFLEFLH